MTPSTDEKLTQVTNVADSGLSEMGDGGSQSGRDDNWVIIWERDQAEDDLIVVRYLGPDPFA